MEVEDPPFLWRDERRGTFETGSLKDLSPLKSIGLHKLSGDRAGQWAMTVNGPVAFLVPV